MPCNCGKLPQLAVLPVERAVAGAATADQWRLTPPCCCCGCWVGGAMLAGCTGVASGAARPAAHSTNTGARRSYSMRRPRRTRGQWWGTATA